MALHEKFVADGLVEESHSYDEGLFVLTRKGKDAAHAAQSGLRRRLLQHRILEALVEAGGELADLTHIKGFDPAAGPVEGDDVERCAQDLRNWGFISATPGWGMSIHPTITTEGQRALESGYAPEDMIHGTGAGFSPPVSQTNYRTEFHGPVGAAQFGNHNNATVTQNIGASPDELRQLLASVRAFATEHGTPQQAADVDAEITAIEQDANDGYWNRVRTGLRALPFTLATTFGEETTRGIVGVITNFIQSLI